MICQGLNCISILHLTKTQSIQIKPMRYQAMMIKHKMAICKSNHPPHQSWIQKIILLQAKTNFEKHLKKEKIPFDILSALLELDESKLNVFWFPPLLKLHSFQIREEITKKRNCRGKVIWTMPKIICFLVISSIRLDNSRHIIGSHLNNSTIFGNFVCYF